VLQVMVATLLSYLLFHSGATACLPPDWLVVICVEAHFVYFVNWVGSVRLGTCSLRRCLVQTAGVLGGSLSIDIVLDGVGVSRGVGPRGLGQVARAYD